MDLARGTDPGETVLFEDARLTMKRRQTCSVAAFQTGVDGLGCHFDKCLLGMLRCLTQGKENPF